MFDGRGAPCSRDYHQRALLGGFSNHRRFGRLAVVSPAAGKKDSARRADYGNARSTIDDDAIGAGANCRGEVRHSVAEDRDANPVGHLDPPVPTLSKENTRHAFGVPESPDSRAAPPVYSAMTRVQK